MQMAKLSPNQIITLNDFPVHNEHVLKIFFKIYQNKCGKIVPPVPIMHKNLVLTYLHGNMKNKSNEFYKRNPNCNYFMLDGSHRTTAATLTKKKIKVMVLQHGQDVQKARKMVETGELFHFYLKDTIEDIVKELIAHFRKTGFFQTVEQKTKRMVIEKVIPLYMIEYYKKWATL